MRELFGTTKKHLSLLLLLLLLLLLAEFGLTFLLVREVAYYFSREVKQTGKKEI
jgi:hypothetical protein